MGRACAAMALINANSTPTQQLFSSDGVRRNENKISNIQGDFLSGPPSSCTAKYIFAIHLALHEEGLIKKSPIMQFNENIKRQQKDNSTPTRQLFSSDGIYGKEKHSSKYK